MTLPSFLLQKPAVATVLTKLVGAHGMRPPFRGHTPNPPQSRDGEALIYQLIRRENWIWREFCAELILPKFEVEKIRPGLSKLG